MTNNTNDAADGYGLTSDGRPWGERSLGWKCRKWSTMGAESTPSIKEMFDKLRPRARRALVAYLMHTTDPVTGERIPE